MVVELEEDLNLGNKIVVKKKNNEEKFSQTVELMEVKRKKVGLVKADEKIAILALSKAKEGNLVYKVV